MMSISSAISLLPTTGYDLQLNLDVPFLKFREEIVAHSLKQGPLLTISIQHLINDWSRAICNVLQRR